MFIMRNAGNHAGVLRAAALQRGDKSTAVNVLTAFVAEVDAQTDKHLTSEAAALLKFNAQYLIAGL